MENKISALDKTPPLRRLAHLIGPCIDRAAPVEPDSYGHAPEGIVRLGGSFIVVELSKKALGVLEREHLADHARPRVSLEHRSGIPPEIVKDTGRRPLADELRLGLEPQRQRMGKFRSQGAVDKEVLRHGAGVKPYW